MKLHTPITPPYPAKENLNASYEEEEECTRWVRGFFIMLIRCIRHYEICGEGVNSVVTSPSVLTPVFAIRSLIRLRISNFLYNLFNFNHYFNY